MKASGLAEIVGSHPARTRTTRRSGRPIFVVCRRASLTRGSSPAQGNGVREVTKFSLAVIEGSGAGLDRVPVEAALESIFAEEGVSGAAAGFSVYGWLSSQASQPSSWKKNRHACDARMCGCQKRGRSPTQLTGVTALCCGIGRRR